MGGRDVDEVGVGPFNFNVRMAEELGWTAEEIQNAVTAMKLLSRGCSQTAALRSGRACEHCGAAGMWPKAALELKGANAACSGCGRKG